MKKRTNTAFLGREGKALVHCGAEERHPQTVLQQHACRTGQREANAKADAWLDDSIRDGKKKVAALYAQSGRRTED